MREWEQNRWSRRRALSLRDQALAKQRLLEKEGKDVTAQQGLQRQARALELRAENLRNKVSPYEVMLSGVWQESTGIPAGSANLPMISGARRGDFPLSVNRLRVDSSRTQAGGGTRSRPGNPLSLNLPAVVSKGPGRSWPNVNIPYQLMKDLLPRRPKPLYQRPTGISVVDPKKIAYTKVLSLIHI